MADILRFGRPEEAGIHPDHIVDYVSALDRQHKMCHSFLMMRHGKVVAEGYWAPFHENWLHRMYSVSKTFVSTAIGMLIDEGRIALTDKIVDYFPDQANEDTHPLIKEMTIRDMLMMATCHKRNSYRFCDHDWLYTFFHPHYTPDHLAGTEFRYDTSATYTLDVLVQRLTGKPFLEYLKDKGLRELGFSEDAWCVESPEGYSWGGSGVECTTRDLARLAMIYAGEGAVGGKRYLSAEYAKAASSYQIDNGPIIDEAVGHGYGYQIWRTWKNTYSFLGMGGQLAIIVPELDFIFCCTGDLQGDPEEVNYHCIFASLWENVLDKIADGPIPEDQAAYDRMNGVLQNLQVALPKGKATSPLADQISGVRYELDENPMGITGFTITIHGNSGTLVYETPRGLKKFPFDLGRYQDGFFPETHYSGKRINQPKNAEYRCLHAGVFPADNQFLVRSYVIDDYFGNMSALFTFEGDRVRLQTRKAAEAFMDEYVIGDRYVDGTSSDNRTAVLGHKV